MTTQLELGEARARNTDPGTAHEAAAAIEGEKANQMERLVLDVLNGHPGGLTSHELVSLTGLPWNTVTPRIRPLVRKGMAIDSGRRRPGPANRRCIVWAAK